MSEKTLEELYRKVDLLIGFCEQLQADNHSLRLRKEALEEERTHLLEKNELARGRVESMIAHLKSLKESV